MGMTTPFPEPDSPALEPYAVYSRVEILGVLRQLLEHGVLVNVYYDGGASFFLTAILAVNPDFEELIFDAAPEEAVHKRVLQARRIVFVAFVDGVKVQFDCERAEATMFDARPALRARVPERALRLQRREFFRVRPLASRPVDCVVRGVDESQPDETLRVLDISGGGVALAIEGAKREFTLGDELPECTIDFHGEGSIAAGLRVRSIELAGRDNAKRIGCEFVRMAPQARLMLQRYINRVEAEHRKAATGKRVG